MKALTRVSILVIFLFIIMAYFLVDDWNISGYHIFFLITMIILSCIADYMHKKQLYGRRCVILAVFTFLLSIFVTLTLIDTVGCAFSTQSFISGFLIISPVLFIISFAPVFIVQSIFTIFFCVMSIIAKDFELSGIDCLEAFYGYVLGMVLYFLVMKLRLNEFRKNNEYKISSQIDYLTQIYNRAFCNKKIGNYLADKKEHVPCAMLVIDIDKFKEVNDRFGHRKGDEVLVKTALIIKETFRNEDIVGRFGGDEFIAFARDMYDNELLKEKCTYINDKMKEVISDGFICSCSIGICMLKNGKTNEDKMFRMADSALYEAKTTGRSKYVIKEMTGE